MERDKDFQEETHCYLLNGSGRSLLIDTGLGICNIYDEVVKLTDQPVTAVLRISIGIISEGINIFRISMPMKRNWGGCRAGFLCLWKRSGAW